MGTLLYGGTAALEIDDRVLSHLKIAVTAKLRQRQGFMLNWTIPAEQGGGRGSIWIAPGIALEYRFAGSKPPELNRAWLQALERSSHGMRGMVLMTEDQALEYLRAAGAAEAP